MRHTKIFSVVLAYRLLSGAFLGAETVSICEGPTAFPINTTYGSYSPPLCFEYAGLQPGQQYVLKAWLLYPQPGPWYCASSQWCERTFTIDNTVGTNSSGALHLFEAFDVHNYAAFAWVIRLYNSGGEVASRVVHVPGTANRAPVLAPIANVFGRVGKPLQFALSASDSPGSTLSFGARNLPTGATFDAESGTFNWAPTDVGLYPDVVFTVTDDGEGPLTDAQQVTITVSAAPVITSQPQSQTVSPGSFVEFSVTATSQLGLTYQWYRNGEVIPGATSPTLTLQSARPEDAAGYRAIVSDGTETDVSEEVLLIVVSSQTRHAAAAASLEHLRRVMDQYHRTIDVFTDISAAGNHFHARGLIPNQNAAAGINSSWTKDVYSGATAIRFSFTNMGNNFAGFYFLNGILVGTAPLPYFGEAVVPGKSLVITQFSGLNLKGTTAVTFWAKGDRGGELIEFFVGGVGRDPDTGAPTQPFPDSMPRYPPRGTLFRLSAQWQQFRIPLAGLNLTNLMGGFGWVANAPNNPGGAVFYLDNIRYILSPARQERRLSEPRFLRSFVTKHVQPDPFDANRDDDLDFVLRNTAFTYDNALAILAFLADSAPDSIRRAALIGDALIYALEHDRWFAHGPLRSAYSAGDIALPSGWSPNGKSATVPIPGFYVERLGLFYEVEQSAIDTGNNAWAMLALLALYEVTGQSKYLEAARQIGVWILTMRNNTGTYQGYFGGMTEFEGANAPKLRPYASTEHSLDIYAAFKSMFRLTGEPVWDEAANHADQFVEAMWDELRQCYLTGTADPYTRNTTPGQLPLDTQSWNVLARRHSTTLHPALLQCAEMHHRLMRDGFSGYDFNEDKDGVWFEGTAQMALAYQLMGQWTIASQLLQTLHTAQQIPMPHGDGFGIVAASRDGISSGFGFKLFRRLHVGATAWNIFAQRGFNPYYQQVVSSPLQTAAGTYNGLFYAPEGVEHRSSGFIAFAVDEEGIYSGTILSAGQTNLVNGEFGLDGTSEVVISREGRRPLTFSLQLDAQRASPRITGRVSDGTWQSDLVSDQRGFFASTNPAPFAGKYMFIIPGNENAALSPGGVGFGTITVSAGGRALVAGVTGDGKVFTHRVFLSREGYLPMYASLYGGAGSLLSWFHFQEPFSFAKALTSWIKPRNPLAQWYPAGFSNEVEVIGSFYRIPANERILTMTNALLIFSAGNLPKPFTNTFRLPRSNVIVSTSRNPLSLRFDTLAGTFSGQVQPPFPGASLVKFRGVVLQQQNIGSGFFLGKNQSGRVVVMPAP